MRYQHHDVRRLLRFATLCVYVSIAALGTASIIQAAEFISLGNLAGFNSSFAYGVSDDGQVVAGFSELYDSNSNSYSYEAFRWTESTGMVGLGTLPGHDTSVAGGIGSHPVSRDGSTIVGSSRTGGVFTSEPFIYSEANGMRGIAHEGRGYAVSANGDVMIGTSRIGGVSGVGPREPFRWTEEDGYLPLGVLPGHANAWATDVSDDGSVIAGVSWEASNGPPDFGNGEIFVWEMATGMVTTGLEGRYNRPVAISNDATVIASTTNDDEAFRWTEETGVVGLGRLSGDDWSWVRDMTPDGRIIVGKSQRSDNLTSRPFVWSETGGMENFQEVLSSDHGLGVHLAGWELDSILGVSSDARYFTGHGNNPNGDREAWLVRLDASWGTTVPEPSSVLLMAAGFAVLFSHRTRQRLSNPTE